MQMHMVELGASVCCVPYHALPAAVLPPLAVLISLNLFYWVGEVVQENGRQVESYHIIVDMNHRNQYG